MKISVVALALAVALTNVAFAETPAEAFAKLEAAINKELDAHKAHDTTGSESQWKNPNDQMSLYLIRQLRPLIDSQDWQNVDQFLNTAGMLHITDESAKATENLHAIVRKELNAKQNASAGEVEALLKKTANTVRFAKDPKDLDASIAELARFRDRPEEHAFGRAKAVFDRISATITFLQRWQDYLAAIKSGNMKQAQLGLRSALESQGSDIIPRSEILDRIQKLGPSGDDRRDSPRPAANPEQIDEIVGKVKNLDGMGEAIKELKALQSPGRSNSYSDLEPLSGTVSALLTLDRMYEEFQAGLPPRIEPGGLRLSPAASNKVIPLEAQLLLLVLPKHLNVSSDLMPKPAETVEAYLVRVLEEAKRRGDLQLMTKTRDIQRWLISGNQAGPEDPGIGFYSAGQHQEAAGQYMLAILSYQNALKNGSNAVPAKAIGERLAALKAAHPQEFEQAMATFLNPSGFSSGGPRRPDPLPPRPTGSASATLSPTQTVPNSTSGSTP